MGEVNGDRGQTDSKASRRNRFPRLAADRAALLLPPVKPGERHGGSAAASVVLNQEPRLDALHAYPASDAFGLFKGNAAVVVQGDDAFPGRCVRLQLAVVRI